MTAILTIGGFRQRTRTQMGLKTLWREDLRPLAGPKAFVHPPVRWCHDVKDVLGTVRDVGAKRLIVVAYSWGVGYGARRVVREALSQGLKVDLVCSCDGVWKAPGSRWLTGWLSVFSMTRLPSIPFPKAVGRVVGVKQETSRPSGHSIRHGDTWIFLKQLDATHNEIDEHPTWRSLVVAAITATLQKA